MPIPVALIATLLPLLPSLMDTMMKIVQACRQEDLPEVQKAELAALEVRLASTVAMVQQLTVFKVPST